MSESGIKVAVFGGNGLVGRQLAAHLGTSVLTWFSRLIWSVHYFRYS
jgi:hypothetical protein